MAKAKKKDDGPKSPRRLSDPPIESKPANLGEQLRHCWQTLLFRGLITDAEATRIEGQIQAGSDSLWTPTRKEADGNAA